MFDEDQNGWESVPRFAEHGQRVMVVTKDQIDREIKAMNSAISEDQNGYTGKYGPKKMDIPEMSERDRLDVEAVIRDYNSLKEKFRTAPKKHVEENKPMPSLLPMDLLIEYLEPAYREGLDKYYRESWRGGFPVSVMIDAAMRHIVEFFYHGANTDIDSSTKKHHLAGAIFSLLCVLWTLKTRPELDDRRKNGGAGRTWEQDKRTGSCDD